MDLLASILSTILVCGVISVGLATAWRLGRAVAARTMRRSNGSAHRIHMLTDTMVHYRANARMMKDTLKHAG
jgi:hypothetical protein